VSEARKPLEVGQNQLELLEFSIDEINASGNPYRGLYGINVYNVRHVIPMPAITPVPLQSACIEGVFHFRGENIPLVNLARYLDVKENPATVEKMVIIAEFNNLQVGFIVHGAHNIRRISWKDLRTPPDQQRDTLYKGITGIALIEEKLVRLLDLEEIVAVVGLGVSVYNPETIDAVVRDVKKERGLLPEPPPAKGPGLPAPAAEAPAKPPPVAPEKAAGGKVVMVVDDSILSREAMSKVLTSSGYSVITVKDGQEAWDRINVFLAEARRQGKPIQELLPLAIVDIEMPQMDGFSLTRLIKENPELQGLKVVLHTSLGGPENIYKGYKMGADEFLVKFNPKLLLELARKFTG
jgi:two-component system, chemotaxis family, chemotaxis protein CheV